MFFAVVIVGLGLGAVMTSDDSPSYNYEGLTESQITNVRLIQNECDTQITMAWAQGGDTAAEIEKKKCQETIQATIDGYRKLQKP